MFSFALSIGSLSAIFQKLAVGPLGNQHVFGKDAYRYFGESVGWHWAGNTCANGNDNPGAWTECVANDHPCTATTCPFPFA